MRTIVLMMGLVLLGGTMNFATAQDKTKQRPTTEEMATKRTAKLTETLKLNDKQKTQVYDLILGQANEKDKVNNTKLTQDERRAAMKELHASFDAKLKGILTAEQLKTYAAQKDEMKNKKHGGCSADCQHGHGGNKK